jgi:glycogen operon protein
MNAGRPFPLGATVNASGVNFAVFSSLARGMQLLLFDTEDSARAARVIELDSEVNRTGHYWHVMVPDISPGQRYAYRVAGPYVPELGLRFDSDKVLLDPYGKAVCAKRYDRAAAARRGDNEAWCMRSVVVDLERYDWQGDQPLETSFRETVIYEMHVGGFTRHPSSGLADDKRGTYEGVVAKIPYLLELGITAVELMPVFQFDWQDGPGDLENYWGYSPVSFFAPHLGYSCSKAPLPCLDEFRDMVKALHRAGLEVILDVVYNHTAEGGGDGPTLCFKGLDNPTYYMLSEDRTRYADFTGTGHTLNVNEAVVRRLIVDSLQHWVSAMHVDGFRFDLASVLSRDESGTPVVKAPILWDIDSDPMLAGTKLIAEAWDAGGLYQVGSFFGDRWKEWNGRFRDDVRSFIKSDPGAVRKLQQRLLGSPDLYAGQSNPPEESINFVTCHDGFTLNDLVSFNEKHNERNGEGNRDGMSDNISWNCGEEGDTNSLRISALRERQIRNALALNLLSIGTPMIMMGDECRRTQYGNNNAYCQNNEMSWLNWELISKNGGLRRYVAQCIRLRKSFRSTVHGTHLSLCEVLDRAHIEWHGVKLYSPDLSEDSRSLAATAYVQGGPVFHLMLNAYWEPLRFSIPPVPEKARSWFRIVDTFQASPLDILDSLREAVSESAYEVQPRSIALLISN